MTHPSKIRPSQSPLPPGARGFDIYREDHNPQSPESPQAPSHADGARHPGLRDRVAAETYAALYGSPAKLYDAHILGAPSAPHVSVLDQRGTSPHSKHRSPSPHLSRHHRTKYHDTAAAAHSPSHRHPSPNTSPNRQSGPRRQAEIAASVRGSTSRSRDAGHGHDESQHRSDINGERGPPGEETRGQILHQAHMLYKAAVISTEEYDSSYERVIRDTHKVVGKPHSDTVTPWSDPLKLAGKPRVTAGRGAPGPHAPYPSRRSPSDPCRASLESLPPGSSPSHVVLVSARRRMRLP